MLSASPHPHAFCRNLPPPARPLCPYPSWGRASSPQRQSALSTTVLSTWLLTAVALHGSALLVWGVTQRRPSPPRTFRSTSHPNCPTEGEIPELLGGKEKWERRTPEWLVIIIQLQGLLPSCSYCWSREVLGTEENTGHWETEAPKYTGGREGCRFSRCNIGDGLKSSHPRRPAKPRFTHL